MNRFEIRFTMPSLRYGIVVLALMVGAARADLEDWSKSVAALPAPEYNNAPPAIVLLDEVSIEIDGRGRRNDASVGDPHPAFVCPRSSFWRRVLQRQV